MAERVEAWWLRHDLQPMTAGERGVPRRTDELSGIGGMLLEDARLV